MNRTFGRKEYFSERKRRRILLRKKEVFMISGKHWPILLISGSDLTNLSEEIGCPVLRVSSFREAWEVFQSRADFSCILISGNFVFCLRGTDQERREREQGRTCPERKKAGEGTAEDAVIFLSDVRGKNEKIPVIFIADTLKHGGEWERVTGLADDIICRSQNSPETMAARIEDHINRYLRSVYPEFFGKLIEYADRSRYVWHTPGHMGGTGFLKAPAGAAFYKYYGANTLRSDLSISVPDLGSLLDHSGAAGAAERMSAEVFGADRTYYVLNGTSSSNQIIWSSQVREGDFALLDRNCHKSLSHAMIRTRALPLYMIPRRSAAGMIGPVRLSEFSEKSIKDKISGCAAISMMALTNSTYDGLCYNVRKILETLWEGVERVHFDEAWFAYAAFHPLYRDHYGLADLKGLKKEIPLIFCSQSTHKLLAALSQSSMLHIREGDRRKTEPETFNESYMMYASTSPQYSMIASLDVATKMMKDQGYQLNHEAIRDAAELRKKIISLGKKIKEDTGSGSPEKNSSPKKKRDDFSGLSWFFGVWQPEWVTWEGKKIPFEEADTEYLCSCQEPWILSAEDDWHGFEDMEENYVMLDPVKLTITTPGAGKDGTMEKFGIPAPVVSRFLAEHDIICEKTDYYSFLLLNSIGTNLSKQNALLTALSRFHRYFEENRRLSDVFPSLTAAYPEIYGRTGLRDHCLRMHDFFRENQILRVMNRACEELPPAAMSPYEAYDHVVRNRVERVFTDEIEDRISAVMIVPYPPGIPLLMGGERITGRSPAKQYLSVLERFENQFPGYGSEIHGIKKIEENGKKRFSVLCIRQDGA